MKEEERKEKAMEYSRNIASTKSSVSITAEDEKSSDDDSFLEISDDDYQAQSTSTMQPSKRRKKKCEKLITPEVSAALDRVKVTDRGATYIAASIAQSLGHNLDDVSVSRSTIRRARCTSRKAAALKQKEQFAPSTPLLLHWDGKLLLDIAGAPKEKVDRVAILVTGEEEKLLGVPKIARGTGREQADACIKALNDWGLSDKVQGLVFDTTASNTGLHRGACQLIEEALGKDLIWIPCRHHVLEVVLSSVFTAAMGRTTDGPGIQLFKRLQTQWYSFDHSEFALPEEEVFDGLELLREEAKAFYKKSISDDQPREDYRELLQLALVFVGGTDSQLPVCFFHAPGALHNSRWMAKAIYSLKMILFRNQFKMTAEEVKGLMSVSLFTAVIYAKFWHRASLAEQAPLNDKMMLSHLQEYPDDIIRKAALQSMCRHLWFFSEHLVVLSLFDDRLSSEVKVRMFHNFKRKPEEKFHRRLDGKRFDCSMELDEFVTERSLKFFNLLMVNGEKEILSLAAKDPEHWTEDAAYVKFRDAVQRLKVVNDSAERCVALIEAYNCSLTRDEDQLQYLLQTVAAHRKSIPKPLKAALRK